MHLPQTAKLLRIFIGQADRFDGKPLYEAIVLKAREMGLAGVTVLKGVMGYGLTSRVIHTAKVLRLSDDLPMVIEIVDRPERIEMFLPQLDKMMGAGLATLEDVQVIHYRTEQKTPSNGARGTEK